MSVAEGNPTDSMFIDLKEGTQLMAIYDILASKPHNPHYLNRYINFVESCQQKNVDYCGPVENHHICPKADDMFPEYADFSSHPWNKAPLTARQHLIAHQILSKTFPEFHSMIYSYWAMSHIKGEKINTKLYETTRMIISEAQKEQNLKRVEEGTHPFLGAVRCVDKNGMIVSISKTDYQNFNRNDSDSDYVHINSLEGKKRLGKDRVKLGKRSDQYRQNMSKIKREICQDPTKNPNYGKKRKVMSRGHEAKLIEVHMIGQYLLNGWELGNNQETSKKWVPTNSTGSSKRIIFRGEEYPSVKACMDKTMMKRNHIMKEAILL